MIESRIANHLSDDEDPNDKGISGVVSKRTMMESPGRR